MKRKTLAALLLVAVALPLLSATSHAGRWVWDDLTFRTSSNTGSNGIRGYEDSTYYSNGATTQPGHADTTAAILISGWAPPPKLSVAAIDTTLFAIFSHSQLAAQPSGITAGGDSISIVGQVSNGDGIWTTWGTPTQTFVASGWGPAGAFTNAILLDNLGTTGAGTATYPIAEHHPATGFISVAVSGSAPTPRQLFGWKMLRFIVISDNTGAFNAQVGHWVYD